MSAAEPIRDARHIAFTCPPCGREFHGPRASALAVAHAVDCEKDPARQERIEMTLRIERDRLRDAVKRVRVLVELFRIGHPWSEIGPEIERVLNEAEGIGPTAPPAEAAL